MSIISALYSIFCSLSSGDDHLDKMTDIEKLLAHSQAEKMRLLEQQV